MLEWQWTENTGAILEAITQAASSAGVKIALEAHPGFSVYNPETLLKLRNVSGGAIGINLDPSHLWWQGVDIPIAIRDLGVAIYHFHAKNVAIDSANRSRNSVLDTKSYRQMDARS